MMEEIKVGGRYRHYKGNLYEVVCLARNSEDLSELVVYRDVNNPEKCWARPASMWNETVTVDDRTVLRFTLLDEIIAAHS